MPNNVSGWSNEQRLSSRTLPVWSSIHLFYKRIKIQSWLLRLHHFDYNLKLCWRIWYFQFTIGAKRLQRKGDRISCTWISGEREASVERTSKTINPYSDNYSMNMIEDRSDNTRKPSIIWLTTFDSVKPIYLFTYVCYEQSSQVAPFSWWTPQTY